MVSPRLVAAALLLLAPAGPATAQTADEIVQKYLDARGGLARLKAISSMRIVRTFGTFGANIPVTITRKRDGL